jgi:hypothetical protein
VALTDNRTQLNDCNDDTQTFSTTGSALGTNTDTGNLIESTASIEVQHSNVYDDTYTSGDSAGATFNLGAAGADSTFYSATPLVALMHWACRTVASSTASRWTHRMLRPTPAQLTKTITCSQALRPT